jgi:hypothetical protein
MTTQDQPATSSDYVLIGYWAKEFVRMQLELNQSQTALERAQQEIAELRAEVERLTDTIRDEYAGHEAYVDNIPCDAGNFDGGSADGCEHCGHQRRLDALDVVLGQAQRGPGR